MFHFVPFFRFPRSRNSALESVQEDAVPGGRRTMACGVDLDSGENWEVAVARRDEAKRRLNLRGSEFASRRIKRDRGEVPTLPCAAGLCHGDCVVIARTEGSAGVQQTIAVVDLGPEEVVQRIVRAGEWEVVQGSGHLDQDTVAVQRGISPDGSDNGSASDHAGSWRDEIEGRRVRCVHLVDPLPDGSKGEAATGRLDVLRDYDQRPTTAVEEVDCLVLGNRNSADLVGTVAPSATRPVTSATRT